MINAGEQVDRSVEDCLGRLSFQQNDLMDFVHCGVESAEELYDFRQARGELELLRHHMSGGYTPLGAELEFSNIGHGVIRDPLGRQVRDRQYDGFLYFNDFALDILTSKLGGHIDDHDE
jgi:hypothetical protein